MNELYHIDKLDKSDFNRGYLQLLEQLTFVDSLNISFTDFCNKLEEIKTQIFVIRNLSTNKIVASGSILIEEKFIHKLGKVGHIEDIVVDENYRKMGFGIKIIKHLVKVGKKEGCYKIILDCSDENIGFYKKCGFKKKGVHMAKYFN